MIEDYKMKIDKVAGGHVPHTSLQQTTKKPLEAPVRAQVQEHSFQADTSAIDKAQKEMASLPNVDMEKVEQIRSALTKGELSLDTKALSKALMQFHTGHE
ncbi:flagellar biosynthesis anti-sigma factor FlgM [Vibrio rotiferianus]|jgi:negative regulator of flagellin synthesis FlgM